MVVMFVLLLLFFNLPAFSISGENSHVVMIAISAAVVIIVLTVVIYILIGRWVYLAKLLTLTVTFSLPLVALESKDCVLKEVIEEIRMFSF